MLKQATQVIFRRIKGFSFIETYDTNGYFIARYLLEDFLAGVKDRTIFNLESF